MLDILEGKGKQMVDHKQQKLSVHSHHRQTIMLVDESVELYDEEELEEQDKIDHESILHEIDSHGSIT